MNYIVLDLEWNQASCNDRRLEKLPFEIIEIGAFKLNDRLNEIGRFSRVVKPRYYKRLHHHVSKIVNITQRELKNGVSFLNAAKDFLDFCGEDFVFCAWGSLDVYTLRSNLSFYQVRYDFGEPVTYIDIQKLYSFCHYDTLTRLSLKDAIDELKLPMTKQFHRALQDAFYTVKVMQSMPFESLNRYVTNDLFTIPSSAKNEIHISFDGYHKSISRGFEDSIALMNNRRIRETVCPCCSEKMHRSMNWFRDSNHGYSCIAVCKTHGIFVGKIRVKIKDNKSFAIKVIKAGDESDIERLKEKKLTIRTRKKHKKGKAGGINE